MNKSAPTLSDTGECHALESDGTYGLEKRTPKLAAGLIIRSRNGNGRDGAWNDVVKLAERHNAAVWAAPMSGRCFRTTRRRLDGRGVAGDRARLSDGSSLGAAKNISEFVAYARANPGKLSYGSAGSGSPPHIVAEMFKRAAMIDATHVPYKGAAPALNDLLGGQVQFMFDPDPGLQHAATGKLTVLAVASAKRASRYPDVPTLAELGMRVDADRTFGVYAPAGISAAIIERMNREITRTLNSPVLVDNMARLGGEVAPMTIQEFVSRQAADRARYGAFIKEAGIRVD